MNLSKISLITLIQLLLVASCYSESELVQAGRFKIVHDINKKVIYYVNVSREAQENKIITIGDFLENWKKLDSKDLKVQMVAAQTILNSIEHSLILRQFVGAHMIKPPIDYYEFRVEN